MYTIYVPNRTDIKNNMNIQSIDDFSAENADTPKKHGFKRRSDDHGTSVKHLPTGVNLIDLSQIVLSTIFNTFKPEDELNLDFVRHCVLQVIKSHVQNNKMLYPMTIICVDNHHGGYWRKKIASYYKFRRKEKRDTSGWDYEKIFNCMSIVISELKENMPYVVMDKDGIEADDHIAVLTQYFTDRGVAVLITSSDSDFTQLQSLPKVRQYSPMQKKPVEPKHGSPENDLKFKVIKGDKKDGIASYRADSDHYTKDGVRAPSISAKQLKLLMGLSYDEMKNVLTDEEYARILENKELLDLFAIPDEIKTTILTAYDEYVVQPRHKIMQYFAKHELKKLYQSIDEF